MTVIAQDDHLTAGAWAACGSSCSRKSISDYPLSKRNAFEGRVLKCNFCVQAILIGTREVTEINV